LVGFAASFAAFAASFSAFFFLFSAAFFSFLNSLQMGGGRGAESNARG